MALLGVCPDCGYKFTLEQALTDAAARQALGAALAIAPTLGSRIIQYMGLFSPAKRAMRMDALANRLGELGTAIQSAEVQRDGSSWAAPLEYWRDGLDITLAARDKLRLPLADHNYLFSIVANMSQKASGQQEQKKEQRLRNRPQKTEQPGPQKVDVAARKALAAQHLGGLLGRKKGGAQ